LDTQKKNHSKPLLSGFLCFLLIAAVLGNYYLCDEWGFYRRTSEEEAALRRNVISSAQQYLGANEQDGTHKQIIDLYNSHEPLAVDYTVQYTDSWCAAFVSAVSIQCKLTSIIPTECGCERQIGLFQARGRWQELDTHIPLPGDIIYYDWNASGSGDCNGWSDHVGIVVGTKWPFMKVIEGNKDDAVSYRYLIIGNPQIRGYGLQDYQSAIS